MRLDDALLKCRSSTDPSAPAVVARCCLGVRTLVLIPAMPLPPPPLARLESDGARVASCAGLLQPTCGRLAFQEAAVHEQGLGYSSRLIQGIGAAEHLTTSLSLGVL